jgi:RecA/RadA recombinase
MSLQKLKIVSKTSIGNHRVYDICVPAEHHYLLDSGVVSHNSGFIYASSIVVAMQRLKLKEDDEGNKVSDVRGIRAKCKVMKTRYSKPFEDIEIKIPWDTGMDPYSGLFDLFEKKGIITKDGNRSVYIDLDGVIHKYTKKEWANNQDNILNKIMNDFDKQLARMKEESSEIETSNDDF